MMETYYHDHDNFQLIKLESDKILNVDIYDPSQSATVELLNGDAEIFGSEMIPLKSRSFSSSFTVYTRIQCTLRLKGNYSIIDIVNRNSDTYNIHVRLQDTRLKAHKTDSTGPIVLVAGPTDVGKSTLTRYLLNHAVRSNSNPLYVDLDVGQSSVSIPGTLSILPVDSLEDIDYGFNDKKLSVYYYGYKSPGFNILLYILLITKLSQTLHYRMENSPKIRYSGAIIDTCGWTTGQGYKSIVHAANVFNITTLIVLDDRNLLYQLKNELSRQVETIFVEKLDGVVVRNKSVRINRRERLIHEYFYGSSNLILKPHLFQIKYSDIKIFKFSCKDRISNYMYEEPHRYLNVEKVSFGSELCNQILAISYAGSVDENIISTSILGFVCVKEVDLDNKSLTILSPKPEPLPNTILIMGDISFNYNSIFNRYDN